MRKMLRRAIGSWWLALALVSIPAASGPALAVPITWEFEAVVTDVFSGPLPVGTTVSGSYTFDKALPDDPAFPDDVRNIITEASLTIPAGTLVQPKTTESSITFIRVTNDGSGGDDE